MGNQLCCEETSPVQPEYQVTVVHKKQPVKLPELTDEIIKTLQRQKPFENDLPSKPTIKEFGEDIYEGKADQRGRPDGFGKIYRKNKSLFLGQFEFGAANGPGFFIKPDGSFYRGLMVDNKAEDQNGYFWSNSYEYKGGVKNNAPHGEGKQYGSNHSYQGEYLNGKKTKGILKWKQHEFEHVYNGQFDDQGLFHGKGQLQQKLGTYRGQFVKGKKNGKGEFDFKTKLRYEGEYINNKKKGTGKVINKNQTTAYEGEFDDGLPHGQGIAPTSDGERPISNWVYGVNSVYLE